ncbi:hypothetical protein K432DRAFT_377395 [Lepidopterella palustris CBS 459.81]|uniref:Ribosomal protein/NADH dehydrogenase domain-containing protein n=1 Tax=Lepidopterella palustris CBS 459.81 TaxID=1314670 RepID=A0A8E2EKR7_9PEZI|nr:hypothetical protein K432DRAFT_377395 [Lepidopterella palustris CBS 459.81]
MTNKTLRMVSILQRMRKLKSKLLAIRVGPGAVILPKDVKRIHLECAQHINGGHRGAKKFWREMLPRLKFRNPAVSMTVSRNIEQEGDAKLIIYFTTPPQSTPTPTSSPSAESTSQPKPREVKIDIKHLHESAILAELLKATGGTEVLPTEVELEEIKQLEEEKEKSRRDSERSLEVRRKRKKEEEMMKQARGEVGLDVA